MSRTLRYNRLSYAIALSLEATRRTLAAVRGAFDRIERDNAGPFYGDGTDAEGFPGGDGRMKPGPADPFEVVKGGALPNHNEPCNDACGAGCPNAVEPRDWTCVCGTVNPSFDPWCSRCEEPRPEVAADPEPPRDLSAECGDEPDTRTRLCPNCFAILARRNTKCDVCGVALTRLRDRVRSKALTAADITAGGEYVPKKGNNKSPNYVVQLVGPHGVNAKRTNESEGCVKCYSVAEFLALVARRADA